MTDDENGNTDQHDNDYLKLKVHTSTGRTYYCNRIEWDGNNNRVLLGAYTEFDSMSNPDMNPLTIIVDGTMDIVPIREGKWILPDFFKKG